MLKTPSAETVVITVVEEIEFEDVEAWIGVLKAPGWKPRSATSEKKMESKSQKSGSIYESRLGRKPRSEPSAKKLNAKAWKPRSIY